MAEKIAEAPRGVRGWRGTAVEITLWSIIAVMVGWSVSTIYSEIQMFHPASHWTLQLAFAIAFAMSNALCAYLYVVYPENSMTRRAAFWGVVLFGVGSAAVQTHYYVSANSAIVPAVVMGSIGPLAEGFLALVSGYMQQDAAVHATVQVKKPVQATATKPVQAPVQAPVQIAQPEIAQPAAQTNSNARKIEEARAQLIAEGKKLTNVAVAERAGVGRNVVARYYERVDVTSGATA